ncbi:tail fiber assembly protein [Pantoea sp. S62]|jgi:hypothetical protein|uniref:tail fiber assembly protein n=1 Tax=Pantoea sp. S62 TaxID=2769342 RepID=UPI001914612A|nr:tail fiber assembly protein [Pantoea sp. S62]MBK5017979.1 tail fiber assembly protein [Pantoea sp. S62]
MAKVTLDKNGLAKSAGTLTVYNFDAVSGEFTGSSNEFLAQGVGLPAYACIAAPPATEAGHVALYRDGRWLAVADHRGETVYSVADGAAVLINAPGDYPADTTPLKPATAWDKWDGEKWVTDTDAQQAEAMSDAGKKKSALISEANINTQAWQTQLLLGIITEEDKATLTKWMKYIQAVQAVNISAAPEISWPMKP